MSVKKIRSGKFRHYTDSYKREVIDYYLSDEYTKQYVWEKFTGDKEEKGSIHKWMRQLGYIEIQPKKIRFNKYMGRKKVTTQVIEESEKIKHLEAALADAELKLIAYKKMIEIAERDYQIPIVKKSDTKS